MSDSFNDYFFTSDSTGYICPGFGSFKCDPKLGACARDPNTGQRYCCDYADVCWGRTTTCASDGSTIDCGDGSNSWCCLNGSEICTQTRGQINICWSSAHDTLTNISSGALNSLYSSLSSVRPAASSYTFDPLKLIAVTATTSSTIQSTGSSSSSIATSLSSSMTSSSSSVSATATSSPLSAASATATSSPSSPISGGAIAGIVIAILAALALLAGGFLFLSRRKKQKNAAIPAELYTQDAKVHTETQYYDGPQELPSGDERSELPASSAKVPTIIPQELPAHPAK